MEELLIQGPPEEQDLCVPCGFCCDGTLFMHAVLLPGEKGSLPEKIEQAYYLEEGKEFFCLPCLYFDRKCTIYDQKRAEVCLFYRCQLLKDFAEKKISREDALSLIHNAMATRDELIKSFNILSPDNPAAHFRELLLKMGKTDKIIPEGRPFRMNFEILNARCNIFEAQLIKYFRSSGEFENMIDKTVSDNQ